MDREYPFFYLKDLYLQIPQDKIIDFIPMIIKQKKNEMRDLKSWERHFQSLKVPYCITQDLKFWNTGYFEILTLWKQRGYEIV